jgi:transcriptional regulator with PAS, ATPase and Fis domain
MDQIQPVQYNKRKQPVSPVAIISPYRGMADMAKEICWNFDKPIIIEIGDLKNGLKKGRELVKDGVEVIISRGGTAVLLKENLNIPIVEIKVTVYDILLALKKIPLGVAKIGIVGFGNIVYGSEKIGGVLNLELNKFVIQKEEEVSAKLEEVIAKGIDIIIGDRIVVTQAAELGIKSILIESGKEAILQSFHEAYEILSAVRIEVEKSQKHLATINQMKAILGSVEDQIIILDSENKIQSCNTAALKIFNKEENQLIGFPLFLYPSWPLKKAKKIAVRNQLEKIQNKHILIDYVPIETNGKHIGTLVFGRNVTRLEQAERKVRKSLYLKGHIAKYRFDDIIGENKDFLKIIKKAKNYASSHSTVLILGETGTGKEIVAQSMHNEKFSSDMPFVAINCTTLPENLLESELFGYAPGAFTGARNKRKKGYFELAHGGTILLDEIGDLPLKLQSRLLRVIEEREVQPIGDERVIPINVRVIASTNKNLFSEVKQGRFRSDLFYRLNVLHLEVSPLRERGCDPYVLFEYFVRRIKPNCHSKYLFSMETKKKLCSYYWPGNVRELKNLVQRLAILTDEFKNSMKNIVQWINIEIEKSEDIDSAVTTEKEATNLNLKNLEAFMIKRIHQFSPAKQEDIAKLLGISRTTLWRKRKSLGLK